MQSFSYVWKRIPKGHNLTPINFHSLIELILKTHLWTYVKISVMSLFRIGCPFSRILTFTLYFQNLQGFIRGFILTWRITFWLDFFFVNNEFSYCECHIKVYAFIQVKKKFVNEASNPTLSNTCLVLFELNLLLFSHHPLLNFGWNFIQELWVYKFWIYS